MPPTPPLGHGQERRAHPRIILKAYGFQRECALRGVGDADIPALLVDLSPGGARLRLKRHDAGHLFTVGTSITLHSPLRVQNEEFRLDGLGCTVRWTNAPEFGVQFASELPVGVGDLQRMLTA
ncbi:PilZ domain-containing protein [Desulfohalovibrio reitneri]|uniref:PilZ domain-containing protein n=1 Tax=Desulfohalovibrio reitneri TaxID=1307759 RepID=UPI0004A6DD6D|nr:PilZ domain-containing protein [Desulfohalovibrio reitneri]